MKRPAIVAAALLVLAVGLVFPLHMTASAEQSGDFAYSVSGSQAEIIGYKGKGGAVVVPSKLGGVPVTGVGEKAFGGCASITAVTLPGSVTEIGDSAFAGCARLAAISLPARLKSLGNGVFEDCAALKTVSIPRGVPDIGYNAFSGCAGLETVSLSYGNQSIGDYAFMGCVKLAMVAIPDSVSLIGYGAFSGCTALGEIRVGAMNANYAVESGILYDKDRETLICCPAGKSGFVAVPDTVAVVAQEAFAGCAGVTAVSLPETLSSIGYWAFAGCEDLTAVSLPKGLEIIGASAFYGCAGLRSVTIPAGVIDAGENTFDGCTGLMSIAVDEANLTYSSRDGVLYDRSGVELLRCPEGKTGEFDIPETVGIVGDWAFSGCAGLTAIRIPEGVFSIGEGAFVCGPAWTMGGREDAPKTVSGLTSIDVDGFNRYFSSMGGVLYNDTQSQLIAFPAGRAGSFRVPGQVAAVGDYAFACCTRLEGVTLPGTVSTLGKNSFSYCVGLANIDIPPSVTSVGSEAFYHCAGLKRAYMENALTVFGAGAFQSVPEEFKLYFHVSMAEQWADFSAYPKQAYCMSTVSLQDGSAATQTAADVTQGRLAPPEAPKRDGYAFLGWYRDAACKTAWDFKKDAVTADVTLYAKWITAAPAAPAAAVATYRSVALSWGAVKGAAGYEVYRAATAAGKYSLIKTLPSTSFTNTGLASGRIYYYKVRAYRLSGNTKEFGGYSAVVSARPGLGSPRLSGAAASPSAVKLSWGAVAGAAQYEVWRSTVSPYGKFTRVASVSANGFKDSGLAAGKTCWYKVRAYRVTGGRKVYGCYSNVVSVKP